MSETHINSDDEVIERTDDVNINRIERNFLEQSISINVRTSEQQREVATDFITGVLLLPHNRIVTLSNNETYDAEFLSDYLLFSNEHEHRDPKSSYPFTMEDMIIIKNALPPHKEYDGNRLTSKLFNENKEFQVSAKIRAIEFCEQTIQTIFLQLLSLSELSSISTMESLDKIFFSLWKKVVSCFCGLINLDPLEASRVAIWCDSKSQQAKQICEMEDDYIYEPTALYPICESFQNLSQKIAQSIIKLTTSEALRVIQNVQTARIGLILIT